MNHHGIRAKISSLHSYNEKNKSLSILQKLEQGSNAAVVTESGTPGISDPGNIIVRQAIQNGINVLPIPGPSALSACISVSGISGGKFIFCGFLPKTRGKRQKDLLKIKSGGIPAVIYENPKRIKATLEEIEEHIPGSAIFLGREMTKIHEQYLYGSPRKILDKLTAENTRGEFSVVIFPPVSEAENKEHENIFSVIAKEIESPASKTAKILSEKYGIPRKIAYNFIIEFRNKLKGD